MLFLLFYDSLFLATHNHSGVTPSEAMIASTIAALAALLPAAVFAQNSSVAGNGSAVLSNGKYEIASEGIRANFVPYGASISNLFIRDVNGIERDIVLGWDNATYYTLDKKHPHLGYVFDRMA